MLVPELALELQCLKRNADIPSERFILTGESNHFVTTSNCVPKKGLL